MEIIKYWRGVVRWRCCTQTTCNCIRVKNPLLFTWGRRGQGRFQTASNPTGGSKRALQRGSLYQRVSMPILQKAVDYRNRKQDSGERAKLRRAAPTDEHNLGQASGDTKNLSSQGREHERASQLQKVVHTDPLALANSSDPCAVRRIFFFLTNVTIL